MKFFGCFLLLPLWLVVVDADNHGGGGGPPVPNVERVAYTDANGFNLTGYVAMPERSVENGTSIIVPAVVIIPDWDGVNLYEQQRATLIAQDLGYVGFAADIYGSEYEKDGVPDNMRGALAGRYRNSEPQVFLQRIEAAVAQVAAMPQVDTDKIALIGYCFGGSGVLMYALDDGSVNNDVAAVVSFHGGLGDHIWQHRNKTMTEAADDDRPQVLVLSGGIDDMATDIITLEDTMDNATLEWEITRYSGIDHAFTVWSDNRYNEMADHRSWTSMTQFLQEAFDEIEFVGAPPAEIKVENVSYVDETDGKELLGYLAVPDENEWEMPAPAVVIFPNWDGVNTYEKERATLLAEAGYVAFAADIYGADLQEDLDFGTRLAQSSLYRSENPELFVSRMQRAVELVQSYDFVDADNVAILGYCFGGTGVVQYAFTGRDDVKVVAAFHGNVQEQFLPNVTTDIVPYTMVLSGGEDDAHGDQDVLEKALNDNMADWEISRYSGVVHGFTEWGNEVAYNLNADIRSWTAMMTAMDELMATPAKVTPSAAPSEPPSDVPSSLPSYEPTAVFSSAPTGLPTSPSAAPSNAPSAVASSMPTTLPTTADDSSSSLVSVVIGLTATVLASLLM